MSSAFENEFFPVSNSKIGSFNESDFNMHTLVHLDNNSFFVEPTTKSCRIHEKQQFDKLSEYYYLILQLPDTFGRSHDVINVYIDKVTWTNVLEQAFLLMIIFGRWLLPKGRISHSELSQLLLTFIGKACDITDFFQIFSETTVQQNTSLTYAISSIWAISLFQFPFVLTATKISADSDPSLCLNLIFETEIWSILVHILMQEFPFMIIRWLIIIQFNVLNYSILFFALKNVLLLVMYIYRIYSILRPIVENANERKKEQPGSIATVSATSANNIVEVSEIDSEMF
ncbi:hypothetical protein KUTeg_003535 [Tegillarca granosa]|uniref:Transmembrane protein 26 n=1 Tax=Tegillarca granosa TaxID=220873 RepID=A0ABQ9FME9_TEGGR|nr:hypothetical protein KUTeg_003535 [Tegillarca granosa]